MISTTLLAIIYVSFISLGLPDSMLGSAWPLMSGDLAAPLWGAGLVQMVVSFGTIVSSLNSARLIRRFGTGRLTALSVALTALALLGFSLAPGYGWLVLLAVPLGLGAGAVDAALNNYVALHCQARHMSWLHCSWGVGTIIGPVILSALIARTGGSWRGGYVVVGVLQAALSAVLFATLPLWRRSGTQEEERGARVLSIRQVLALPGAKAGLATFLCYCALESTLMLWAPTFMVEARGISKTQAVSYGALVCVGITAGRAVSGFMTMRFRPRQMVVIGQAVLLVGGVLLLVPVNTVMLAGVVVCGLGCAPIYPNIIQDTPVNYGAENSQAAVGVQMAAAYLGSTFMPTIFGALASRVGYGVLPGFALAVTAVMAALFAVQKRQLARRDRP